MLDLNKSLAIKSELITISESEDTGDEKNHKIKDALSHSTNKIMPLAVTQTDKNSSMMQLEDYSRDKIDETYQGDYDY